MTMATGALMAIAAILILGRAQDVIDVSSLGLGSDASVSVGEGAAGERPRAREANDGGSSAASDHRASARGDRRVAVFAVSKSQTQLVGEPDVRETAECVASPAKVSGETLVRAETERSLEDAQQQLANERSVREETQRDTQEARERLSLAERSIEAMQEQLAAERNARLTAEIATQEARQKAKERGAKDAAERALKETHLRARHATERRSPAHARRLSASPSPI